MTGFHVDPDRLDQHAAAIENIGQDVGAGAAAEAAGTGQAEFGILIGATLGAGVRALSAHFEEALRATSGALTATGAQLRGTAQAYRDAEAASHHGVTSAGGTP